VDSQGCRLITVAIPSGLKIPASYILLLYIDDMLVAEASMKEIVYIKANLAEEFSMKDFLAKKILGMSISRKRKDSVDNITSRVCEKSTEKV